MAYSDWQDHDDHDDAPYVDHHDHTDSDCQYTDWADHNDNLHSDHDDHEDSGVHSDWDDHADDPGGGHTDWGDYYDWADHENDPGVHIDHPHGDHDDHDDWSDGAHADWYDHSNVGFHTDLGHQDHNDHTNWTDAHSDWYDHANVPLPHQNWDDHDDTGDPHSDWDDHDDVEHDDNGHSDWDDHNDTGDPHTDWDDHDDWPYQDHDDYHLDHTDIIDWTDHGNWDDIYDDHADYADHDDSGAHIDWDDHGDGVGHTDWDDYSDGGVTSGKTHVSAFIGGKDVSCYVISADIWRDALNGIGRWELILDNQGHWWGGAFSVDDDITIRINGSLMMRGYVDDVFPYIDSKGEYTELIKVSGRDYGMDLAQLYVTRDYPNRRADDTVDVALLWVLSEITYTSPSAAPVVDYEADRTYLADIIRDLAKLVNYDFYVEDDANKTLHFFDIATMGAGAEHTTVDLLSIEGLPQNNILRLEIGEGIGFEVKNTIETHAGDLNDHWTDLNAAAWDGGPNVDVDDDPVVGGLGLVGKGAIRMTTTAPATWLYMDLRFPLYNHTFLDMSKPDHGKYCAYPHNTTTVNKQTRLRLRDTAGNWIEWFSITVPLAASPPLHKTTDNIRNDAWRFIEFSYGDDTEIKPAGSYVHDTWQFVGGATAFNWARVNRIRFTDDPAFPQNNGDYIIIDGLEIPAIEVISIQQDAVSIAAYGTRMKDFDRPDIRSQVELEAFATEQLPKFKDPVQSVKITAIGQVDSKYAAQSLDVRAPRSGITWTTPYRIFTLHHSVKLSPLQNEIAGYDFITEYELIKHEIDGTDQPIDPTRVLVTHSPTRSMMRKIREEGRYRKSIRVIR